MKEFHRRDFANRTGLAQAWTVKSADRLFTGSVKGQRGRKTCTVRVASTFCASLS